MKLSTFAAASATTAAVFAGMLYTADWRSIPEHTGGVAVANDEAGRPCYWYEDDQQLMCFSEFTTWYGAQDAVPVYVIEHGVRTDLFADRW